MKTLDKNPKRSGLAFLSGGEMGRLIRSMDWSKTPLGPIESWPQNLRTAVSICLDSRYPIFIAWGEHQSMLYNDAYTAVLSGKHPSALGLPAREVWAEIWHVLGPLWSRVVHKGEATWSEDLLLVMNRNGYDEETYFTFSYSPVRDERGSVEGMFCACQETTEKVIGERRLRTLRELAAQVTVARSAGDACAAAMRTMAANPADVPFALLYLAEDNGKRIRLAGSAGLRHGAASGTGAVELAAKDPAEGWPLAEVFRSGTPQVTSVLPAGFGRPFSGWPQAATQALVLPLSAAGREGSAGVLVAGVSPVRPLDDGYRTFFEVAAGQIAAAIVNAQAYEQERMRAEALAEIDRAKTAFFSNVSHEFRTPLTLMLGPLEELLARKEEIPPGSREQLDIVRRNSLRLLKLVNTLLDFSRIEAGRIQATYEPVDLATYTAELASTFRSAVEKAGMRLVVDCPRLQEPVYVDREMWEKIVLNLLSNAFKFTLRGEIGVSLKQAESAVEMTVRDTGTGIPESEILRIFERFHRAERVEGRTYEGTGIGLALVQELVKLHGGSIRVRSTVGEGSAFTVSIPRGLTHLPADRIRRERSLAPTAFRAEAYVEEAVRWLSDEQDGHPGASREGEVTGNAPPEAGYPTEVAGSRILLADDNTDMREYVRRLLGSHYRVETVPDGLAALETARRAPPDLVLTDVMMPRMDGFALLKELRTDEQTRSVPVILLSARAGEESRVEGLEAGADDYIVKPFSARELIARVEAHLKLAQVRRESEAALRQERDKARKLLEIAGVMIVELNAGGKVTTVNKKACEVLASRKEEIIGKDWIETFLPERVRGELRAAFQKLISGELEPVERMENPVLTSRGDERIIAWHNSLIMDERGECIGTLSSGEDITERKKMEEEIRHLAHHDSLTGLPNRLLLMDILRKELAHSHRSRKKLAVLFLDMDRFKYINDTLGHDMGDRLLRKVADRLRRSVREADTVARIGGDEFTIMLTDLPHAEDIITVAQNVLHAFQKPYWISGHELYAATSIGISIYPDDAQDIETLFKNADIAMYHAKEQGGSTYQFYDSWMNIRNVERMRLEHSLRQAIAREELVVYYQPQLSLDTRQVVCAEALVRWEHPELGILNPTRFVPLAEETGFIASIDEWVLRTACTQFRQWQEEGYSDLCVTVNLSAKQFKKVDLVERIARILAETGLPPRSLSLEITESIAMENLEHTIPSMHRLVEMGVGISIDDFGTGYSSLSYLKRLPVNKLKIDQSFVRDIATDPDDRSIVKAVTALAQTMQLSVVAEGVETEEQLEFLKAIGCHEMQGYLFSKPLPAEEFRKLVAGGIR